MANPFDEPGLTGESFYDAVRGTIKPLGGRITSTSGGRHNVGSAHYSGGAVDVGMARESLEQQEAIKAQLEAAGYRVRDERKRPAGQAVWSGPHLHVSKSNAAAPSHRLSVADSIMGGSGGGGGGGGMVAPASSAGNPFEQLGDVSQPPASANPFNQPDAPADLVSAFRQINAERAPGSPSVAPMPAAPVFSNVQSATGFSGGVAPDYSAAFTDEGGPLETKNPLLGLVQRSNELVGSGIRGFANIAQPIGDKLESIIPLGGVTPQAMKSPLHGVADWFSEKLINYSPTRSLDQVKATIDPNATESLMERLGTFGAFAGERVVTSVPDMAASVAALPAYLLARTNEIATKRVKNDGRTGEPGLADMATSLPAATGEALLERFATKLLPGLGRVPGATAPGRIAAQTGIQAGTEAAEEGIANLGESLGTKRGVVGQELADAMLEGGLVGGSMGGAAQGASEAVSAAGRPRAAAELPADAVNIAELLTQTLPPLPAVAAEGPESPRQGDAPAAPPTPAAVDKAPPAETVVAKAETTARPDMDAATRSIDGRLAALDDAAAGQIEESEVSALNAERQELDDLLREQDRAKRDGVVQPLNARLSSDARATADARRTEITASLERHRAARTSAEQAQRLRDRLENTDSDASLFEVAREINPTLGTQQAEQFRTSPANAEAPGTATDAPATVPATPSVPAQTSAASAQAPSAPIETTASTTPNVENVGDRSAQGAPIVGQRARSEQPSAPPAAATETGIPVAPRAESQREPAPTSTGNPVAPKTTSLKNAVTDAERVAEGRDPIIREARKGNRETVDEAVQSLRDTPSLGRETAQRLAEGGPVELKDEAVLLVHKVALRKRRNAAADRAQSPNVSEEARAIATREYDDAVQQIDEVNQAASRIGTESGRLLQLRRRMISEDFSMPALERKLKMVVNRELKPAEQAEVKELAEKVATLQRKLDSVESQQASAQVAEMLARLMKQSTGKNATLAQRRSAAAESKAALSAMSSVSGSQQSIGSEDGKPGQARAALTERLGRGVVARLERAGVLVLDDRNGGTWDGTRIGIGNVAPENALGVLLHEVSHANMLDVLGEQGYERALSDLDALESAGDPLALKAKRRAAKSGETGQRLDDERIAYMVEEATNATAPAPKVTEFLRSVFSAFRRWAATSPVFRALEKAGVTRPSLKPADFVAFARTGLDRMVAQARQPVGSVDADRIRKLETELRTDYKTGIRNQRAFDEDADLGWKGVAAMDMDGLKKINDQLGHDAGDAVLRALANELAGAETTGARFYRLSGAGDEFAGRFKTQAEADRMMGGIQSALDGLQVELDVADTDGNTRYYAYQGIGISYGTGADYGTADTAANKQKADRLESGIREAPRTDGPSRRIRESAERAGGRRESDPPAVGSQRSVPEGTDAAPAGADPVAFFHLAQIGAFHYADGARDVAEWMKRMEADIGPAAAKYRSMLPDAFKASQAQATKPQKGAETVAEAMEAIGDKRRPRDVKRVVRAVVAEGMRGEDAIISSTAQALDMEDADVRTLFVQSESQARTLTEAQAELKDLRKKLRDAQKPDPETRYQNTRGRDFERRIAEIEDRIAAGDFAKRERVERPLTKKTEQLRFELERTKIRFHQYAIAAEFAQRTPLGKLWGQTYAGINFSRAIMTALDLSAVFRQGGFIAFGHPKRAANAIPTMFKALVSERADFLAREEIQSRPNAPMYSRAGLQLTGIGGDALSRVEETFASRWVEKMASFDDIRLDLSTGNLFKAGAKVPFAILGGGVRGSGRAYTAFLNRLRADSFDAMVAALARNGENPTKAEIQAIAKYINVATGRGDFFGKQAGEAMTAVFFAPRLVASRFQLIAAPVTGFSSFGGSVRTQKLIAQEYARFLIGVSVFITLAAMMRDDDDETKMIELDPRSSAFGKIRIGDTFIDPLGGLAQVTVFTARTLSGETRKDVSAADAASMARQGTPQSDRDGGLKALRESRRLSDYVEAAGDGYQLAKPKHGARDSAKVIWDFTRSKFSPVVGWTVNLFTGEDYGGQQISPTKATTQLVVPMSVGSVVDVMEAHGMVRGTAINMFNILGAASQYRKSKAEQAAEEQNGVAGALGFGTADDYDARKKP